jgi:antitoxin (DNA-binding transcriptional repressor) of toxin-antitoxin stability system
MRAVGLKVLKNKLSEYVRLAENGETIFVTDRDRVVAELAPPRAGRSPFVADAMLAEVVRQGWITPPLRASEEPPLTAAVAPLATLLQELAEDRGER